MSGEQLMEQILLRACKNLTYIELQTFTRLLSKALGCKETLVPDFNELTKFKKES